MFFFSSPKTFKKTYGGKQASTSLPTLGSNKPKTTNTFNAKVFWMSKIPFDKNEKITLKCATQEIDCRIQINKKFDSSSLAVLEENAQNLNDNDVGEVTITTDEPIVIENFNDLEELGRFVLVKGFDVTAGGIITE